MKRMLILLAVLAMTLPAGAQVLRAAPKIVCDNPVFEFGEVDNTESILHTFILRNEGTGKLIISNVKAACGCTVAKVSSKNLAPGEEAKIDAVLNLKGKRGAQNRKITVYSNDANTPVLTLAMVGNSLPLILAEPFMISFGNIEPGKTVGPKTVTLTAREGKPFKIKKVEALRNMVQVEVKTIEEGKKYELIATPIESAAKARFFDQVRIHTDLPTLPVLDISASGKVVGPIEIIPEQLYLTPRGDRAIPPRYIMVAPGTVKEFKVEGVDFPGSDVQASILPLNSTAGFRGYRVVLKNIIPTEDLNGKKMVIRTDVAGFEKIEVPLVVRKPLTSLLNK